MKIDLKKDYKFWLILIASAIIIWLIALYNIQILKAGYLETNAQNVDIGHLQEFYSNGKNIAIASLGMLGIVGILSVLSIHIYYNKKLNPEKLFWFIIPVICIMFLVLMPAFKSHDEGFHWFRIQDMAQGNLLTKVTENKPLADLKEYIFNATTLQPENITYAYIGDNLKQDNGSKTETVTVELATTSIYNPIQYMPQTLRSSFNESVYR